MRLSIQHLTKKYGNRTVVNNLSVTVGAGETLVLLGTSGCGKTTTLRMINRLIEPSSGQILGNDIDIRQQDVQTLRRSMGYVMQESGLFPHYTVAQNIAVVPRLLGWEPARIMARTLELMAMLRLPDNLLNHYPAQLSGGQRQRVGLARALAADPPIVLMDEPFGALDPITRAGIRQEFAQLEALRSKTIVLVTHDVAEAFALADQICLMDAGVVQQYGKPHDLLDHPANAFVQHFFDLARQSAWLISSPSSGSKPGN